MSDKNNLVYQDQLDDNVIEMLSEDIGNNYSLRTENTRAVVGALNEIKGKDIISNAVGSPLVFDDTFEVMGEKIKGLTNNFKAKLLNLGVSVSSIDKFEALIGKLDEIDLGVDAEELIGPFIESLSGILEDEGVELSGNETLGDLIIKVDEEFDKYNNTINDLNNQLEGKVTPAGTAVAGDVLSGKTFMNSTGQLVTGTMTNRGGAQTVTPGTSNKTLNAGYYSGNITVQGDSNLKAENIKSGVSIFGINGTLSSSLSSTDISKSQVSYKTGYILVTHNLYVNMSVLFCQVGTHMHNPGTGVIYVTHYTGNAIISNLLNTSESTAFNASYYNDYYSAGDVGTVSLWITDITNTSFRINYKYEYDITNEETDGLDINVSKIWYM